MNTKNENVEIPSGWIENNGQLERKFEHDKYAQGVEKVFKIAKISSDLNHHPEITLKYSEVVVSTFSHDINAISGRDIELAKAINAEFGD